LADPDSSLLKIAGIIEQDIGISAKILQLANSAFFGTSQPVANIQTAVGYLGLNALKCLVLSVEIFKVFKPRTQVPGFSLDAMQRHAQLTTHIVSRLPVPKHFMDVALVSCMLHDVGKLIQAWKLPERFAETIKKSAEDRVPLYRVEEGAHGFSHAEIGAYLLGIWGLPYPVVETVALHHSPNRVPRQGFDAIAASPSPIQKILKATLRSSNRIWSLWEFCPKLTPGRT
jgi:HD-like signal output (HDOD) protein